MTESIDVSLRLLRAFALVAHEGSVGRAAQRLSVSQPSLSQDVRRLERLVGVSLFVRTPRGMDLSPAGQALLAGVEAGLRSVDRGVVEAAAIGGLVRRTVRIALSPSVGHRLLPALIPALDRIVPDIVVDGRDVDTSQVGPGVRDNRYDLGLAHCPEDDPDLATTLLAEERMCAAVAGDHPIAGRPRAGLADLAALGLILWPRATAPAYYDHLLRTCARAGFIPPVIQGPRRATVKSYLLGSRTAFCLLPASAAGLRVPGVAFLELVDEHARIPLHSLRRADDRRPEVMVVEGVARDQTASLFAPARKGR